MFLSNLLKKTTFQKMEKIALVALSIWVLMPIVVMFLCGIGVNGVDIYAIWLNSIFYIGGFGLLFGIILFYKIFERTNLNAKEIVFALLPILLLVIYLIWSLLCCLLAEDKYVAFFGQLPMNDCWFTYLLYGGIVLLALILSNNRSYVETLAMVFLSVSNVLAVISIIDNDFTRKVNVISPYTNCFHYQSVFYNTNHYGYYLLISIIVVIFCFLFSNKKWKKTLLLFSFILLVNLLILNNTLGAYLALMITMILIVLWNGLYHKDLFYETLLLLLCLITISAFSKLYSDNLFVSLFDMASDVEVIASGEDTANIGSERGKLWKNAIENIVASPIFGCGFENVGKIPFVEKGIILPHNIFLQFAKYTGLPGLYIYVTFLVLGMARLFKQRQVMSNQTYACMFLIIGYLISEFFGVTKFYISPYFLIILGICMGDCLNGINKKEKWTKI